MTVSDQLGNIDNLTHIGQGIYRGTSLLGVIGNTYSLRIDLDGTIYEASSTMPPLTNIDSITIIPTNSFFGGNGQGQETPKFWAFVNYTDSVDYQNYYAIRTSYFDSLRKVYPDRFEYERYRLTGTPNKKTAAIARELLFKVP